MNLGLAIYAFSEAERKDNYYYLKLCCLAEKKLKLFFSFFKVMVLEQKTASESSEDSLNYCIFC